MTSGPDTGPEDDDEEEDDEEDDQDDDPVDDAAATEEDRGNDDEDGTDDAEEASAEDERAAEDAAAEDDGENDAEALCELDAATPEEPEGLVPPSTEVFGDVQLEARRTITPSRFARIHPPVARLVARRSMGVLWSCQAARHASRCAQRATGVRMKRWSGVVLLVAAGCTGSSGGTSSGSSSSSSSSGTVGSSASNGSSMVTSSSRQGSSAQSRSSSQGSSASLASSSVVPSSLPGPSSAAGSSSAASSSAAGSSSLVAASSSSVVGSSSSAVVSSSGTLSSSSSSGAMPPAPVCNPAFRGVFAPLVDAIAAGGAAGPGQTVVDNTRTIANGETLDSNTFIRGTGRLRLLPGATVRGNIYVLGQGVLEVAGDAVTPAVVGANIYLFDDAVMQVTGQLNLDQQFSGELLTIGLDRSAVNYTNASVQQGRFSNLLYSHVLCGSGGGTVSNSTWMRGNRGTVVFFVRDSVHYVINGAQATLFELTAGESSRFTLSNTTGSVGAYFELGNTVVAQPATLRPNPSLTATVSLTDANGRGPVYEFNATDVFFGLWHGSGVDVTLVDSALPLFSRMDEDVTVTGLAPGMFGANAQVTAPFPDRSIKLLRTEVYLWNAYMERPVTVRFQQSRLGELACSSQAHCVMEDCQLDGTGGFITVKEDATLDVLGGQMTSLLTAQGNALVRLTGVAVSPELDGSDTRLQANGNATIFLQNTVPMGAVTPTVYDNGALVFALIDQPAEDALLGSMVTVTGAATSLGVATAPGAFQSWTLQLENSAGAMVQQIASGSTPVDFTVFTTFAPTPGLPAGNYAVVLRVDTVGGVNIALARRNVRL